MAKHQQKKKGEMIYDYIAGLALLALGVSSLIGGLGLVKEGFIGNMGEGAWATFGYLWPLCPLCLIILAKQEVDNQDHPALSWEFLGSVLTILGGPSFLHGILSGPVKFNPENLYSGGGLVGSMLFIQLHEVIGNLPALMLTGGMGLLGAFLWLPKAWYKPLKEKLFAKKPQPVHKPKSIFTEPEPDIKEEPKPGQSSFVPPVAKPVSKPLPKFTQPPKEDSSNAFTYKEPAKGGIYNNPDFSGFQGSLKKPTVIERIFGSKDDSKPRLGQSDPVDIAPWQRNREDSIVLRPQVDYDLKIGEAAPAATIIASPAEKEQETASLPKEQVHPWQRPQPTTSSTYTKEEQELKEPSAGSSFFDEVDFSDPEPRRPEATNKQNINIYDTASQQAGPKASQQELIREDGYLLPPFSLLNQDVVVPSENVNKDIYDQCAILEQTLADFKVKASVRNVTRGPSVTRFELEPAPGVKVSSVVNLADDIALRLAAAGVRIEAPIPGKSAIGIEAPNTTNDPVYFREVVEAVASKGEESPLVIGLGKAIDGNIITCDLAKMPHLLIAGSTGSGKSVCINTIITGILFKAHPDQVKLILVDPKVVELSDYNGIPHLLTPVVTEPKAAASALHWAVGEMERRYKLFADTHVRNINDYNKVVQEGLPFIVIIIDELADLMMVAKADVEAAVLRLAQKARAAGIHLILATQRPSVDVITGIVKANIPSRIAFAVSSQVDSRTILDMSGAEKLLGKGDMLFCPIGQSKPVRVQGAFVADQEVKETVRFIVEQSIPCEYDEEVTTQALECDSKNATADNGAAANNGPVEDELFADALELVLDMGQASASMLQRRFRIGYTRAARLVDTMEELGIVGHSAGSKPREVIMSRQEVTERFLQN